MSRRPRPLGFGFGLATPRNHPGGVVGPGEGASTAGQPVGLLLILTKAS